MERKYWKHKEVQQRFGRTRATINRWVKDQGFPKPVHFGDPQRSPANFPIEKVEEWEAKQRGNDEHDRPPEAGSE